MIKLEFYDNTKTYMYPTGAIANPERVKKDYPATEFFKFVVTTNEAAETIYGLDAFNSLKSNYQIDASLSDDEALAQIEEIMNTPQEVEEDTTPTPEERIAAALEYQALSSMEDTTEETTTTEEVK